MYHLNQRSLQLECLQLVQIQFKITILMQQKKASSMIIALKYPLGGCCLFSCLNYIY